MAKQIINNGTIPGDGTGEVLFSAFSKVNDNFDELYLTNVVYVNSPSDFPAAVAGVRELSTPGINMVYMLGSARMDMGTDLFTVTSGNVTIKGINVFGSAISSLGVGNLFTSVDSSLVFDSILWDCPNATIVDFSVPTAATISFLTINCIVINCDKIFNIDGAFTSSLKTLTVFATQTGGILWTGAQNQLHIDNFLGNSWAGKLIDLGTATFNLMLITGGRFVSPAGTTILSGASASANLNVGARGIVGQNLFNGLGTAISGIDTEDLQWSFDTNIFADNSTKNTETIIGGFTTGSITTTIGVAGTYVGIGGTLWATDFTKRFTITTAGVVTYIGLDTIDVAVIATSTVEKVGGGADVICSKIAINGTVSDKTRACTQSSAPTGISSNGLFELETGDTIQLFVANETTTSNVITSISNMIISKR